MRGACVAWRGNWSNDGERERAGPLPCRRIDDIVGERGAGHAVLAGVLAGGGIDGLKAISPFAMAWGWRNRDLLAVVTGVVVFAVFSVTSMTAAIGFAAQHRAAKQAERLGDAEQHGDLRRQLARAENRLGQLGLQRSSAEVAKAIEAALKQPVGHGQRTVGEVSEQCTLNREHTRESCAAIAQLVEEQARAEEAERLEEKVREIRQALDQVKGGGAQASEDPQVETLMRLLSLMMGEIDRKDVQFALAVLLAPFIELGSGVGLYLSTTPWRKENGASKRSGEGSGWWPAGRGQRDVAQVGVYRALRA